MREARRAEHQIGRAVIGCRAAAGDGSPFDLRRYLPGAEAVENVIDTGIDIAKAISRKNK